MSNFANFAERGLLGRLLKLYMPLQSFSTRDWARNFRFLTASESSFGVGRFDPDLLSYMEYLYDCLDNPFMPEIGGQKSARIGWTEVLNNYRAKTIDVDPKNMMLGFPVEKASRTFAKGKWATLIQNTPRLKRLINVGVSKNKESLFDYVFAGGSLRLVTLGSISNQKSDNIPYIEIEEPDDAPDDVNGQGDTLSNLRERQKTIPITMKKLIFGGTPTHTDFSRVETLIKNSNQLIFKAECHECEGLVPMDGKAFAHIHYDPFPERRIDPIYGAHNPESAKFFCPHCGVEWTFEQKNKNVTAGKKHGFIDHTGNFSKGWHPLFPNVTSVIGFVFSELLSPLPASSFVEIAKSEILALNKLAQGDESLMKSYTNNRKGMPYSSGISSLEAEEMKTLRSNYTEGVVPFEGLILTAGIDIQHNRFAIVVIAWGQNGRSWLVEWCEIFGNVLDGEDEVWIQLSHKMLSEYRHEGGKTIPITAIAMDTGDGATAELAYRWVRGMSEVRPYTFATKGVRDLSGSHASQDAIYIEPSDMETTTHKQARRSLAESMGVTVYSVGAHIAQDEVLRRINLLKVPDGFADRFFFCETKYGGYEEQMTSCRKLLVGNKLVYKLVAGKRKEAMDCTKLAFWATYALRLREYTSAHWTAIEYGLTSAP